MQKTWSDLSILISDILSQLGLKSLEIYVVFITFYSPSQTPVSFQSFENFMCGYLCTLLISLLPLFQSFDLVISNVRRSLNGDFYTRN